MICVIYVNEKEVKMSFLNCIIYLFIFCFSDFGVLKV